MQSPDASVSVSRSKATSIFRTSHGSVVFISILSSFGGLRFLFRGGLQHEYCVRIAEARTRQLMARSERVITVEHVVGIKSGHSKMKDVKSL